MSTPNETPVRRLLAVRIERCRSYLERAADAPTMHDASLPIAAAADLLDDMLAELDQHRRDAESETSTFDDLDAADGPDLRLTPRDRRLDG